MRATVVEWPFPKKRPPCTIPGTAPEFCFCFKLRAGRSAGPLEGGRALLDLHDQLARARHFAGIVFDELLRTRAFVIAAALAFYSVMALIPMLVIFSSLLGYLP